MINISDEGVVVGSPGCLASFLRPASPGTRRCPHFPVQRRPYFVSLGVLDVLEQAIGHEHFQLLDLIAGGKERILQRQEYGITEAGVVGPSHFPNVIIVIKAGGAPVIEWQKHVMAMVGIAGTHHELPLRHEAGSRLQQLFSIFDAEKMQVGPAPSVVQQAKTLLPSAVK